MQIDIGKYNKNQKQFRHLVQSMYDRYPNGVTLPAEYAHFMEHDLLRFLIRLARYKFVAKLVKKSDSVLEVGTGSGLGSIFLGQYAHSVKGIDVKTTEINEAKLINKRKNVQFEVVDLFRLRSNQLFDVVVALDVIEHYSVPNGKKLVASMARHIKKNGILILGTPSIYSYPYQGALSRASHVKCYDQQELSALVDQFFGRTMTFSMNDEIVSTGNSKMAWYYFVTALYPLPFHHKAKI